MFLLKATANAGVYPRSWWTTDGVDSLEGGRHRESNRGPPTRQTEGLLPASAGQQAKDIGKDERYVYDKIIL